MFDLLSLKVLLPGVRQQLIEARKGEKVDRR
jgi:hypothetical protein